MNVWVVLGERGDYSDRVIWVSGVFTSREAAEKLIVAKSAEWRVCYNAYLDWFRNGSEGPGPNFTERGEIFEIVEIKNLNEWFNGYGSEGDGDAGNEVRSNEQVSGR